MPDAHARAAAAYGNTGRAADDQREIEAYALLKAARAFEDIRSAWGPESREPLNDALLYNRKLWTIFAAEAANEENPLPLAIRNNIANISLFVFKRTVELMAAPSPEKIVSLVNINKAIAAGLLGTADEMPDVGSPEKVAEIRARAT